MTTDESKKCSDCQSAMASVIVMDKVLAGNAAVDLQYRMPDDQPSFWTNRYPTAGPVKAYMCSGCGRIYMYGESNQA